MLSEKIVNALNAQVENEANASFSYLSMACWCDKNGLQGCAQFFYRQSDEEHMHMLKMMHYIADMDGLAEAPKVEKAKSDYASIQDLFKLAEAQEQSVTRSINHLVDLANSENDHTTHNFLQWYVTEQREEEAVMRQIGDTIQLIGTGPMSLYYIDKEISLINAKIESSETTA